MTSPVRFGLRDVVARPGGAGSSPVLQDCTLSIAEDERVAVAGRSGAGKTTLLRVLAGLVGVDAGQVLYPESIGWLPQHPATAFDPRWSVLRAVAEPLRLAGTGPDPARKSALEAIGALGLEPALAQRRPHALSGGELRRAALARALIGSPAVLLADEPTAGLDPVAALELIDLVRDHVRRCRTALLWVTHDLGVAAAVADRLLILDRGGIVEEGPVRQLLRAPQSESARRLTDAWLPLEPERARELVRQE